MWSFSTAGIRVTVTVALLLMVAGRVSAAEPTPSGALSWVVSTDEIDEVWPGEPVEFALLRHAGWIFAAYYDEDRFLTVAWRKESGGEWSRQRLQERVGWDAHLYIALEVDATDRLHLAADMHASPLHYYRSAEPLRPDTLERLDHLVDPELEQRLTYPEFWRNPADQLIFTFRTGAAGNGDQHAYIYDATSERWAPLSRQAMLSGEGERNAYLWTPLAQDSTGRSFTAFCWREAYGVDTNHTLSAMFSRDLASWERSNGVPYRLPITYETGEVIDPIEEGGGLMNGGGNSFDQLDRPIATYTKYDAEGRSQIFAARLDRGQWLIRPLTEFQTRWEMSGRGTIPDVISFTALYPASSRWLMLCYHHAQEAPGLRAQLYELETLQPVGSSVYVWPATLLQPTEPGLGVKLAGVAQALPELARGGTLYLLRWQSLGPNRDRPRPADQIPPPQKLELVVLQARGLTP